MEKKVQQVYSCVALSNRYILSHLIVHYSQTCRTLGEEVTMSTTVLDEQTVVEIKSLAQVH